MAEKDFNSQIKVPNVDEMSDIDFISSIDYLSSPYYKQYVNSHANRLLENPNRNNPQMNNQQRINPQMNNQQRNNPQNNNQYASRPYNEEKSGKKKNKVEKVNKLYVKKYSFSLALILILLIVVLASAVVSSFGLVPTVEKYASTYTLGDANIVETATIGICDPIIGAIKNFVPGLKMDSNYYDTTFAVMATNTEIITKITVYAVPVACLLIMLCVLIGIIKAIVALAGKANNGYYKKIKFGFMSWIMFISALILVFAGLYSGGVGVKGLVDFITMKSIKFNAGYALYGYLAIPIITLLLSSVSYKKLKKQCN